MLKKISKLFLGLVVCAGSACVTPTHASSADSVVLVHIQAGSPNSAKEELVSIYNNSANPVDITGWCLKNKSQVEFSCFDTTSPSLSFSLPPYSFAVAVSEQFAVAHQLSSESYTQAFSITNQSSGSIVNSADTVSLINKEKEIVDEYSWVSAIPSGKSAIRNQSISNPNTYDTFDPILSWSNMTLTEIPPSEVETIEHQLPVLSEEPENEMPLETAVILHPLLTEVFPNPIGNDSEREFIEVFNPSDTEEIHLSDYTIRIGKTLEKVYSFPLNTMLQPLEYRSFYNSEIPFILLNTTSKLRLVFEGRDIGEVVEYMEPEEDTTWSFIDSVWRYGIPTPNEQNQKFKLDENHTVKAQAVSEQKPCAANQYRSTETNRCRLITTAAASIKECSAGQYRHPDTNRCRNSASPASTLTPCKEGQERNTETNRCRSIVKMTNAEHAVKAEATESNVGVRWYWWVSIGGVVTAIATYAVWEWRVELQKAFIVLRHKFARTKQ